MTSSGIDHHVDVFKSSLPNSQPKLAITTDDTATKEGSSIATKNDDISRSVLGNDDPQDDESAVLFDLTLSQSFFHLPQYMKETAGSYGAYDYPPLSAWLLPHQTWTTITNQVYQYDRDTQKEDDGELKILYLVRHGEGEHNAAEAKYGSKYWDEVISKTMKYFDPSLTGVGAEQCEAERENVRDQMGVNGMPLDTIILSPLKRTIETGLIVFQDSIDSNGGDYKAARRNLKKKNNKKSKVPMISDEYCRETMGVHTCDKRHNVTYLQSTYPNIDFSMIETDDDTWWRSSYRETSSEIDERARVFLHRLFSHDYGASTSIKGDVGKFVAVVSHSGFIQACVRALGGEHYYPANAEVVPLAVLRTKSDVVASLGVFGRSGGGEDDTSFTLASYLSVIGFVMLTSIVIIRYGYHIAEIWYEKSPENPCRRRKRRRDYLNVLEMHEEGEDRVAKEEEQKRHPTASF